MHDAERLRGWKNAHRGVFFHGEEITPEAQARWMEAHLARPHDTMFVIERAGTPVGCMGFRVLEGRVDVYNVILGHPELVEHGTMAAALRMLITYARTLCPEITAKIMSHNAPVVSFVGPLGFETTADRGDHYEIRLVPERFAPLAIEVSREPAAAPRAAACGGAPAAAAAAAPSRRPDRAEIRAELRAFVAERSPEGLAPEAIDPAAGLFERGYVDSIGAVEMLAHAEDRWGVSIDEDELAGGLRTLDDVVARVEELLATG
jgi:acyl carrier protein/RimJ/RimL family protein N-acetyltransferase